VPGQFPGRNGIIVEGDETVHMLPVYSVDEDFLMALGMGLAEGRAFSEDRPSDAGQAFMVNEAAARLFGWTGEGTPHQINRNGQEGEVVGVVQDFHFTSLHQEIEPLILTVRPDEFYYLSVRIRPDDVAGALGFLEDTWRQFSPTHPFTYTFLDADFERLYQTEQKLGQIFGLFAGLALAVACLGLFGLAAFMAEQRTKEIGIRKVMGATVSNVVVLLSRDFARLVVVAFVLAAPLAYLAADRWLADFAYRVDLGWAVFALAGVGALLVALLTVGYQALKVALADPVHALRYE
jgi:putative ABC transport system permease protein